jgi:hypothetical protein
MGEITNQIAIVLGVLVACFAGPAAALFVLIRRQTNRTSKEPLEQAERQAAGLAKWLSSAVGSPVSVLPVVALPGWFVERTGRGRVRVFSGKELAGLLRSRGTQALTAQDVQRIAHQVEQRCRTVAPRYAQESKAR